MKQSRVSAFARAARCFALAAVALVFGAGPLLAQGSTGKIKGRVRDQAGAPIAGAQVFIERTEFSTLTNPRGYYFINNVPAGIYSFRAAFIGYKSIQIDGVKVLATRNSTVDIQLEQTAVQIQQITFLSQTHVIQPTQLLASTSHDLSAVHTVPDPYYVTNSFETPTTDMIIKFVNLPAQAIIRIYSCSGVLVSVLEHNVAALGPDETWNVRNRNNQVVGSGVYFYNIESGSARRVGRFTVVNFLQ